MYSSVTKWYNFIYFGAILISSTASVISNIYESYFSMIVFSSLAAIAIASISIIVGVAQDRRWSKWLAMGMYSLYIVLAIGNIVNWFIPNPASGAINLTTVEALDPARLVVIILSVIGIISLVWIKLLTNRLVRQLSKLEARVFLFFHSCAVSKNQLQAFKRTK